MTEVDYGMSEVYPGW